MKMLGLVISLLCLALSLCHPVSELDNEWQLFKTRYNKKYDETGEMVRRVIWEDNLKYIWQHNLRADRGEHSFRLGMNQFGDMTREEIVKQMNGYRMEKTNMGAKFLPPDHVIDLPATVDWRKKGYVTPVKNQGKCGSCWAFSSTGSLEGQHFRKSGTLMSLSEQNLIDCSRPEGNNGCEGGLMDYAFNYIKINHGIDTEQSYPYQAEDGRCRFKSADIGATDTGFMDIERGSESDLQQAAATVGPISVAIDASQRSFHFYESGVYDEPMCSSTRLDHGVLVVGYGDEEGQAYWLVKNSWGRGWGMEGYIMMSRNKDNQCGIATSASYPLV